jgi:xylose isomerase
MPLKAGRMDKAQDGMVKMAIITSFLGQTRDRFHEYNSPLTLEEKFHLAGQIKGVSGVEVVYPYEVDTPQATKALAELYGLEFAAINVNVKSDLDFRNGGPAANSKEVRDKAVRFIKEAKDFAAAAGSNKVTCCPLADGYEFSFQSDYGIAWKRLAETFGEAGDYRREIGLFIEYKPSETRGTCFLSNAAKVLLLLKDIGIRQVGITLDFGHSIYGGNNPAEELALVAESGFPYYVHINDNDGKWDWDYFCGSKHFLEYAEFLWYLRKYRYAGYITSDTSPTRWDIRKTFETNNRITRRIWALLDELGAEGGSQLVGGDDYLATWLTIEEKLFKLKDPP